MAAWSMASGWLSCAETTMRSTPTGPQSSQGEKKGEERKGGHSSHAAECDTASEPPQASTEAPQDRSRHVSVGHVRYHLGQRVSGRSAAGMAIETNARVTLNGVFVLSTQSRQQAAGMSSLLRGVGPLRSGQTLKLSLRSLANRNSAHGSSKNARSTRRRSARTRKGRSLAVSSRTSIPVSPEDRDVSEANRAPTFPTR
jgi:hypothetical protein